MIIVTEPGPIHGGGRGRSRADQFATLLQGFYQDLLEQGVPERLAGLVRQIADQHGSLSQDDRPLALVVESNEESRALAATLLEETELVVIECAEQSAALAFLKQYGERIAFVFVDEELAGPDDGFDLARSTATLWPHVHVVVTTGRDDDKLSVPEGVRALRKPWRGLDVLLAAERALADRKTVRL